MFEEQVEKGVALLDFDVEKQVALGARELGIYEGGGFEAKGAPVEGGGEFRGKMVFEKGARIFRGGKGGFEQFVVGLMDAVLGHEQRAGIVVLPKDSDLL